MKVVILILMMLECVSGVSPRHVYAQETKVADAKSADAVAPVLNAAPAPPAQAPAAAPPQAQAPAAQAQNPAAQSAASAQPAQGSAANPSTPEAPTHASVPAPAIPELPAAKKTDGAAEEGEYEIDYEEEPADGDEEKPAPKSKGSKKVSAANSLGGSGGIQGSRAKHRFIPILKSETKSVYKKDGKVLDVDSD